MEHAMELAEKEVWTLAPELVTKGWAPVTDLGFRPGDLVTWGLGQGRIHSLKDNWALIEFENGERMFYQQRNLTKLQPTAKPTLYVKPVKEPKYVLKRCVAHDHVDVGGHWIVFEVTPFVGDKLAQRFAKDWNADPKNNRIPRVKTFSREVNRPPDVRRESYMYMDVKDRIDECFPQVGASPAGNIVDHWLPSISRVLNDAAEALEREHAREREQLTALAAQEASLLARMAEL